MGLLQTRAHRRRAAPAAALARHRRPPSAHRGLRAARSAAGRSAPSSRWSCSRWTTRSPSPGGGPGTAGGASWRARATARPNPSWIPAGNEAVRLLAEEIDGVAGGSISEVFNMPGHRAHPRRRRHRRYAGARRRRPVPSGLRPRGAARGGRRGGQRQPRREPVADDRRAGRAGDVVLAQQGRARSAAAAGEAYRRLDPVAPHRPAVPTDAPAAPAFHRLSVWVDALRGTIGGAAASRGGRRRGARRGSVRRRRSTRAGAVARPSMMRRMWRLSRSCTRTGCVGAIQWSEETEPDYRHASIDIYLDPAVHGRGLALDAVRTSGPPPRSSEVGHHRIVIDPAADNAAAIASYAKVRLPPGRHHAAVRAGARRDLARRSADGPARGRADLSPGGIERRIMAEGRSEIKSRPYGHDRRVSSDS